MFCCCNTVSANDPYVPQIPLTRQPQTEIHLHRDFVDTTFSHPSFHLFRFSDVRLVLRLLQYRSRKGLSNSPFMVLVLLILDSAFIFFTLNRSAFWAPARPSGVNIWFGPDVSLVKSCFPVVRCEAFRGFLRTYRSKEEPLLEDKYNVNTVYIIYTVYVLLILANGSKHSLFHL